MKENEIISNEVLKLMKLSTLRFVWLTDNIGIVVYGYNLIRLCRQIFS